LILRDIDPAIPFESKPGENYFHTQPFCHSFDKALMTPYPGADFLPENAVVLVPTTDPFGKLATIMDMLLSPKGCPWDREQTHKSLVKYLIEESYEAVEAIEKGDLNALAEELGDVLLQPVFHMQIASRNRTFEFEEPLRRICDKLIRRHPHVFSDTAVEDAEEVLRNWDSIKKSERSEPSSILAGVPPSMPALSRALEISKRAARAGFEWKDLEGVREKVIEEIDEIDRATTQDELESEFGDLLFSLVNYARWKKIDPEAALRQMVLRFQSRFENMEENTSKPLTELSFDEWDELWNQAKKES
jgi:tetrapyrrole methylase family protein / MazG family protein